LVFSVCFFSFVRFVFSQTDCLFWFENPQKSNKLHSSQNWMNAKNGGTYLCGCHRFENRGQRGFGSALLHKFVCKLPATWSFYIYFRLHFFHGSASWESFLFSPRAMLPMLGIRTFLLSNNMLFVEFRKKCSWVHNFFENGFVCSIDGLI
jgi:hypothetical protein